MSLLTFSGRLTTVNHNSDTALLYYYISIAVTRCGLKCAHDFPRFSRRAITIFLFVIHTPWFYLLLGPCVIISLMASRALAHITPSRKAKCIRMWSVRGFRFFCCVFASGLRNSDLAVNSCSHAGRTFTARPAGLASFAGDLRPPDNWTHLMRAHSRRDAMLAALTCCATYIRW